MTDTPTDSTDAMKAARLGWLMVEVRGRYEGDLGAGTVRSDHVLPLEPERSAKEKAIETEKVLLVLATELDADLPVPLGNRTSSASRKASEVLPEIGRAILAGPATTTHLQVLANFLFEWDTVIQDMFASKATSHSDAYQLGKGFSEIRWMLKPDRSDLADHRSWAFLLGSSRVNDLTRLLHRMLPYYGGNTTHALAASLWAWGEVAKRNDLHSAGDAMARLTIQAATWHDLLLTQETADTLLTPEDVIENVGSWFVILKKFWGLALIGAIAVVVTVAGVALIATNSSLATRISGAVAAGLGLFGISSAGIAAKLKTDANGLLDQLRDALYQDLVAAAATFLPAAAENRIARQSRARKLKNGRWNKALTGP